MLLSASRERTIVHRWAWLILLLGSGLALVAALLAGWPLRPITATDINQDRLDTALPAPQTSQAITQTFVPRHNGLTELKLILVKYEADAPTAQNSTHFTLTLRDARGERVATQSWTMRQLTHNQELFLRFAPQPDSAGQAYQLRLTGNDGNLAAVWGYQLKVLDTAVLDSGQMATEAQILRFTTRYQLLPRDALAALSQVFLRQSGLILLSLLLVFSPSAWLIVHPRLADWDIYARWGLALAVGVSAWALLWLWPGLLGWRWGGWSLWPLLVAGWATAVWLAWRNRANWRWPWRWSDLLLPLLLLCGWFLRLLAVRDLTFLPWVDASRHALITAVMRDSGQTVWDYLPYLPVERTPYHYGFHALPASLQLLTAEFWPLETTLLLLMQLLGALVPLAIYSGGWLLTRRRSVALLAAFLVTMPFYFPGYFVSWGRLTQLAGLLILPLLLGLSWAAVSPPKQNLPRSLLMGLLAVLASGLFLVHFRVFIFYVPLAALLGVVGVLTWRRRCGNNVVALLGAGLLTAVLVAPRLWQLLADRNVTTIFPSEIGSYHAFPVGYVNIGWERYYWYATAVMFCFLLLLFFTRHLRVSRLLAPALLMVAWVGLTLLLTPGDIFPWRGVLPAVNLNSLYIMFFVPQSLFLATAVVAVWPTLGRVWWVGQVVLYTACGALLMILLLFGLHQQVDILNEETRLAWPQDQAGLAWVRENIPPEAKLAVNSWLWLPGAWASSDGGGWLLPLAQRQTSTPPVDYTFDGPLTLAVMAFNEEAEAIESWDTAVATEFLRQHGITHVYVGQKGGFLDPAELAANPDLTLLYQNDGVFIFSVDD